MTSLPLLLTLLLVTFTTASTYDYIVVGGGTAGVALSTRLSQYLPKSSILLIEAGQDGASELGILIPGRKGTTLGTKLDWNFTTVPQEHLGNRVIGANRGKVLGGSSAINLLCWDRAAVSEYQAWEDVGNPGWGWKGMQAAMARAENYTTGPPGSGTKGPVRAVVNRHIPAHQERWVPAAEALGFKENKDSLRGVPIGVSTQPSSIDADGWTRSYSASAYLPLKGGNLDVLTGVEVVRVELEKRGGKERAVGVVLGNGTVVGARREVVLSAGAFQTPVLLELSGIGRAEVLKGAGIEQRIELAGVGEGLQDHIRVQTSYQLREDFTSFDILRYNATFAAEELAKWQAGVPSTYDYTGSGFVFANWKQVVGDDSALVGLAKKAVGKSKDVGHKKKLEQLKDAQVPQVEVIFSDGYTGVKGYPAVGSALHGKGFFTLIAGLMHPLSSGSVHVDPTNPLGKPLIDPKYLDNEYDVQAMVELAKFGRRLALSEPLKSTWTSEYEPGLDKVQTDAEWREYVLNTTLSIFHPTGTASMLPKKNGGVVDSELRVYGTANLRVVDASVIPVQISAHIQTAVYGIAEKAAEIIASANH
ncbi:hypothetical protein OQA88_4802 [Cercophora sp. LCS_1]